MLYRACACVRVFVCIGQFDTNDHVENGAAGFDCSALSYTCAAKLAAACDGLQPLCLSSCAAGLCTPGEIAWPLTAIAIAVVVVGIVLLVHRVNRRRRKKRISEHRQNMTMMVRIYHSQFIDCRGCRSCVRPSVRPLFNCFVWSHNSLVRRLLLVYAPA